MYTFSAAEKLFAFAIYRTNNQDNDQLLSSQNLNGEQLCDAIAINKTILKDIYQSHLCPEDARETD